MPHTALYRKKRPRTFNDVVGQQHIVRTLCNQVASGQISHAYLFCGTRGTGKTSIARIMARAINCTNPADGNPCNECESCIGILAERNLNVVEIDAASNNSVENVRDLREDVKYQPTSGLYKVYIIDEVHMLSTSAFNALLKTLEEPPSHVVFILATTDQQKLPATILSRCQRYDFRRISAKDMTDTLKKYLTDEGVSYEEQALDYITYHSDGAMRDALSLLDQSLGLGDSTLTYSSVLDMLGAVDRAKLFEFTAALAARDSGALMQTIKEAMDGGRDAAQFTADLIRHFRDVLVASLTNDPAALDFSAEIAARLQQQGAQVPAASLMEYIHAFSETLREMRFAPQARTALEVCALRICVPKAIAAVPVDVTPAPQPHQPAISSAPTASPQPNQTAITTPPVGAPLVAPATVSGAINNAPTPSPTISQTPSPDSPLQKIAQYWDAMCMDFPNPLRAQCTQCGMEVGDGRLELIVGSEAMRNILKPKEATILTAISQNFGLSAPPNLAIIVREGYNKPKVQTIVPQRQAPQRAPEQQVIPGDWATAPEPEPTPAEEEPALEPIPEPENNPPAEPPPEAPIEDEWSAIGTVVDDNEDW